MDSRAKPPVAAEQPQRLTMDGPFSAQRLLLRQRTRDVVIERNETTSARSRSATNAAVNAPNASGHRSRVWAMSSGLAARPKLVAPC